MAQECISTGQYRSTRVRDRARVVSATDIDREPGGPSTWFDWMQRALIAHLGQLRRSRRSTIVSAGSRAAMRSAAAWSSRWRTRSSGTIDDRGRVGSRPELLGGAVRAAAGAAQKRVGRPLPPASGRVKPIVRIVLAAGGYRTIPCAFGWGGSVRAIAKHRGGDRHWDGAARGAVGPSSSRRCLGERLAAERYGG